jgi:hypothetical protein
MFSYYYLYITFVIKRRKRITFDLEILLGCLCLYKISRIWMIVLNNDISASLVDNQSWIIGTRVIANTTGLSESVIQAEKYNTIASYFCSRRKISEFLFKRES